MSTYKPLLITDYSERSSDASIGRAYIDENRVATVILAGGVGSRLGMDRPKALVEIAKVGGEKQTLLEALLTQCPKKSYVGIIGSEKSIDAIKTHAKLLNDQLKLCLDLCFFCQKSWPYLDHEGEEVHYASGEVATAPRGNGESLEVLQEAFFFDKLASLGVKALSIIPIDNPLAHPFDPELIGAFIKSKSEVAILTVKKEPKECVGVLAVDEKGHVCILEYTELLEDEAKKFPFANAGIYILDLSFCVRAASSKRKLRYQKKEAVIDGVTKKLIKQETYLFDVFASAKSIVTFEASRENRFMPIKIPEDLIAFS